MSQDQPETPSPTPQPSPKPSLSFPRTQTIKFLRAIIGLLEQTIEKLETSPEPATEAEARVGILRWWDVLLNRIRSFLPATLNQKLSDLALSGILTGVVVVVLGVVVAILPSQPPEVAEVPPSPPVEVVKQPSPVEVSPPVEEIEPTPPIAEPIPPMIEEPEEPPVTVLPSPTPKPTPTPKNITPPELTAPKPPVPVKIAPPPAPMLTPEQRLIATIQEQVATVTQEYADGLISSLQADFAQSLLVVRVSPDWYTLASQRQNQLADEMLKQAKNLDFARLEITDPQGALVARSPVVGDNMIIVKRQNTLAS